MSRKPRRWSTDWAESLGAAAFKRGTRRRYNPFSEKRNPYLHEAWNIGWMNAEEDAIAANGGLRIARRRQLTIDDL